MSDDIIAKAGLCRPALSPGVAAIVDAITHDGPPTADELEQLQRWVDVERLAAALRALEQHQTTGVQVTYRYEDVLDPAPFTSGTRVYADIEARVTLANGVELCTKGIVTEDDFVSDTDHDGDTSQAIIEAAIGARDLTDVADIEGLMDAPLSSPDAANQLVDYLDAVTALPAAMYRVTESWPGKAPAL